ncbi:unnamed protein product [Dicrocoelium dendriticum]|nr:unnamed protein product [Dicrocoelium dendriticum]
MWHCSPYHTELPEVYLAKCLLEDISSTPELDRMQTELHDVHVPIELFSKIDAGQNPQLYTREFMEQALAKNEAVRELSLHFPNEMAKYRAVRGDPEIPNFPSANLSGYSQSNGSGTETGPDSVIMR